jgi:hypothetical protein
VSDSNQTEEARRRAKDALRRQHEEMQVNGNHEITTYCLPEFAAYKYLCRLKLAVIAVVGRVQYHVSSQM